MKLKADPYLSVIIPTLDEEIALAGLLHDIQQQIGVQIDILVADGGSHDGTLSVANQFGARTVVTAPGRGRQLNAATKQARSPYFLVLHADSRLPHKEFLKNALQLFLMSLDEYPNTAGHFAIRFARSTNKNKWAFRYPEEKSQTQRLHTINGDQGLLITKKYFEELGSFDETMNFFEDQILADRIFSSGRWILLPGTLTTSGRRFETEGFHKRYILMSLITGLYWADVHGFFKLAKGVYNSQKNTSQLKLWPFFSALWTLQKDLGLKETLRAWYRVGRYVRQNSWQMFFFFDVAFRKILGPGRYPMTRFHDLVFWPLTNHRVGNLINAVLCFTWFMLLLGPFLYLSEKRS